LKETLKNKIDKMKTSSQIEDIASVFEDIRKNNLLDNEFNILNDEFLKKYNKL